MTERKIFDWVVMAVVMLVHAALMSLLVSATPPQLVIGAPGMEVVDLGDLNMGQAQLAAKAAAPPPVLERPKPEKKILTVKSKTPKPDIVLKEKPKPKPLPETQETPLTPVENTSAQAVRGESEGAATGGEKSAAGGQQAGSGQGSTAATHLGGHLRNPKPPYPSLSLENNEQGAVGLRVTVEPNGLPSSVEMVRSSGYPRLDRSALKTVREQYRFIPATRLGVPVRSVYTFNIQFRIDKR